jgi:hypothetical protein
VFVNDDKLRELIKEAVIDALTAEITLEKHKDDKTGMPLAAVEIIKEKVFLPAFWAQNIKFQEGAFRGVQKDLGKKQGEILEATKKIESLGNFLVSCESMFTRLAQFTDLLIENKRNLITDASDD